MTKNTKQAYEVSTLYTILLCIFKLETLLEVFIFKTSSSSMNVLVHMGFHLEKL